MLCPLSYQDKTQGDGCALRSCTVYRFGGHLHGFTGPESNRSVALLTRVCIP